MLHIHAWPKRFECFFNDYKALYKYKLVVSLLLLLLEILLILHSIELTNLFIAHCYEIISFLLVAFIIYSAFYFHFIRYFSLPSLSLFYPKGTTSVFHLGILLLNRYSDFSNDSIIIIFCSAIFCYFFNIFLFFLSQRSPLSVLSRRCDVLQNPSEWR